MASDPQPNTAVDDTLPKGVKDPKAPEQPSTSDNDVAERPVRKKLSETTIESTPQNTTADEPNTPAEEAQKDSSSRDSSRGRKRSLDNDAETEKKNSYEQGDGSNHRRKRSRDSKPEGPETENPETEVDDAEDTAEKVASPKKKRSRDQVDKDETKGEDVAEEPEGNDSSGSGLSSKPTEGEPEKKRHRDDSRERGAAADPKSADNSAFSNTAAVSPFGALGSSKTASKDEPSKNVSTSASAFASSSLSSFAGSEQSPFGSIGSTASVFKKSAESADPEKPSTKGFAAAEGPSPFASKGGSGFGALGSGFGGFAAAGKPGGLTSFASPGGPSVFSDASKAKPFGAPEEGEEEKEESAAESGPGEFEQDKTDERFYEREIETGEEEEKTYFSSKAKLFQFSDKEWRERGIGTFKVNLKASAGKGEKIPPRLIMRADGVLRVMLNTPIFKGMTVGDASGKEPKSKQIHLASLENDRSVPILLRMPSEDLAKELYHCVRGFLEEL